MESITEFYGGSDLSLQSRIIQSIRTNHLQKYQKEEIVNHLGREYGYSYNEYLMKSLEQEVQNLFTNGMINQI